MTESTNSGATVQDAPSLLRLQALVLETVATDDDSRKALDQLCHLVEELVPGSVCSTMVLTSSGVLNVVSAPSAPVELVRALNGLVPSDMAGSCGTAVFQKKPVCVTDTSTDPRWAPMRELAQQFNLEACWSVPIFSRNETVLGSFAISHQEKRTPTDFHKEVFRSASYLAGIILEKERLERDKRKLEEEARHQHKMDAVGQLAAGMAHEFNNVLAAVLGNIELLLMKGSNQLPKHCVQPLEDIKSTTERAVSLTRQLLGFSHSSEAAPMAMCLTDAILQSQRMLNRFLGDQVRVETNLSSDLWAICADVGEMQQVIMNLVMNARDALANGGTIQVSTSNVEVDVKNCGQHASCPPGDYVLLCINDNGSGMSAEQIQHAFEPFFTTKPAGVGTGLGLATVSAIVDRLSGRISLNSQLGRGTSVKIYLPRCLEPIRNNSAPEHSYSGGNETILLCEDNDAVRNVIQALLSNVGYSVLPASNADQAIELMQRSKSKIDILLTDVEMPGISGRQLADQLIGQAPDTAVIFMSGLENHLGNKKSPELDRARFLQKPIEASVLFDSIRDALGDRAS